jgi:hypothetical protein
MRFAAKAPAGGRKDQPPNSRCGGSLNCVRAATMYYFVVLLNSLAGFSARKRA